MVEVQEIERLLHQRFSKAEVTVTDDSARHAGHAEAREGGGSHFTVRIVSQKFAGMNRVMRHRSVYALLQPLFDRGLHALALETKTPEEA